MSHRSLVVVALGVLGATARTASAVPGSIAFSGVLTDAVGPIDGPVAVELRLVDGDEVVYVEQHAAVEVVGGSLSIGLGSADPENNPLELALFKGSALELEVLVNDVLLEPRLAVQSVPYAFMAAVADDANALAGKSADEFATASHSHDGRYLPLGSALECPGTDKMTGIDGSGNAVCSADVDTNTQVSVAANGGLAAAGNNLSIAANGVTTARLDDGAVTSTKIAAGAVGAAAIASGAVGAAAIATDAIGSAEIATNAVGADEIAANAVGASEIATGAVGSAEIAGSAVTRSALSGTEVSLFNRPSACGSPGLTTSSTCVTTSCTFPSFFNCSGSCNRVAPETCALNRVGYLLSPAMP